MFASALLLYAVVVATGEAVGRQQSSSSLPSTIISPSPPIFTKNEEDEHDLVWKVMKKACFGKWSGIMQCFRMEKATNSLILKDNELPLLNFRLWAKADTDRMGRAKDTGTWTVWNLQRGGDKFVVPLRRLPGSSKPSQLKIGFLPGCVLRVPHNYKQVPRPVIELGYWGSNGIRRTVVLEYQAQAKQKQMELKDVTLVIQRAVPWYKSIFFVGNTTDAKDIEILEPRKVPSNAEDLIKRNSARKPVRIERVQLQSMKRVVTTEAYLTADDKRGAKEVLESLLLRLSNDKCAESSSYDVVLPIELLSSYPKALLGKGSSSSATKRFIFAHEWKNVGLNLIRSGSKTLQALVIDFDAATGEALTATMYSYM